MRESKLMKLLALLFGLMLVAAACGSDDDTEGADDSADTETEETVEPDEAEDEELDVDETPAPDEEGSTSGVPSACAKACPAANAVVPTRNPRRVQCMQCPPSRSLSHTRMGDHVRITIE